MTTFPQAGASRARIAAAAVCVIGLVLAISLLLAPRSEAAGGQIVIHDLDGGAKLSRVEIRKAEPLDPIAHELPTGTGASPASTPEPAGKPGYVQGYVPPNVVTAEAFARAGAQTSGGFGSFTSRAVPAYTDYPNTTTGRVVGKMPGFGAYSCTASVVHARNQSTLFTAGHCVKEPGGSFASELTFVPSYRQGTEPFGRWAATSFLVKPAWARKGNSNFDYAAVVVQPNASGKVEAVVGSQGFAYNVNPKKKKFRAVGYPFNRGDTQIMWECRDRFAGFDPGYRGPGPKPIGIGCDMLGGASGGPWTLPGIYLNSVTSFGYDELPNHLFGPQFTRAADKLRKSAGKR
jgi:V8-like Glu-specific endopeptidase